MFLGLRHMPILCHFNASWLNFESNKTVNPGVLSFGGTVYRGQQVGLRVREGNKLRHKELELRVAGEGGPTPEGRHGEED